MIQNDLENVLLTRISKHRQVHVIENMKKLSVWSGKKSEVSEKDREKRTCLICPLTFSIEERCVILHFNEISPCLARTISEQD